MKKLLLVALLAGVAVAAYGAWVLWPQTPQLSEKNLHFANVQVGTMRDVISATGLIEPREVVYVSSEMPGTLTRLVARVNDTVAEGAELGALDERKIALKLEEARNGVTVGDAAVAQAKATLTQAKASQEAAKLALKTQEELANKGGFRTDRDQAEAQVRAATAGVEAANAGLLMAQAKLQTAQTGVRDAELAHTLTTIKVPEPSSRSYAKREFLILERKVQEGQMVGPQSGPLFVLAGGLDTVEVHAQVAEGDINKVQRGQTAVFTGTTFNDDEVEFRGTVKDIRPVATTVKGAVYYDTVIEVANQKDPTTREWRLRPGMTASVDIIRREHKGTWKVPSAAMNFQLDEAFWSAAAKAHVTAWRQRNDASQWQTLWVWDTDKGEAEPVFVRVGGTNAKGEPGLKDSEGNEVLEWEPGKAPPANTPPRVIIGAPPAHGPGLFDQPAPIKVS